VTAQGRLWRAGPTELSGFALDEAVVEPASGALRIRPGGGHAGADAFPPGGWNAGSYYHGGRYTAAAVASPVVSVPGGFDTLTPSFEAATPPGTWLELRVAARVAGAWTPAYVLGVWAEDAGTVRRHSVDGQKDAQGAVQTDTLVLSGKADAFRLEASLFTAAEGRSPSLRALAAAWRDATAPPQPDDGPPAGRSAWGRQLDVPARSQLAFPVHGPVWCSPTSTSMLLAYWSQRLGRPELEETVPAAAEAVVDWVYDGTGNWTFNTAHAATLADGALHALVVYLASWRQVEALIAQDIPLAISVRTEAGELTGAPYPRTSGHLLVLRGFTPEGDVLVNDPAAPSDEAVARTYRRAELERVWLRRAAAAYVLWPAGTPLPAALRDAP
jgi:hypothetical protein